MTLPVLFFVLVAAISIAAAIGVVTSNQPVHSALYLLLNFVTLSIFYIMLDAQFLAAIQIVIYAGGIVILILFVIMLLGSEELNIDPETRPWTAYAGLVLGVVMLATISMSMIDAFSGVEANASAIEGGVPEVIGTALFTQYVLPFELTAVLILVALLGALLLGRNKRVQS